VLEAAAKLIAYGVAGYFREAWHVFDFSVVLLTLAEWALDLLAFELGGSTNPTLVRVLRIVRVTRVLRTLRAVRSARGLIMMLSMLLLSLPALMNTLGVFLLVLFMYSLLAMSLFGRVISGEYLTEDSHFCDFTTAVYTMFRCSTGEDWNGIMHDAMATPETSDCSYEAGDCGSWLALPFFISYVVLTTYVVLKMLIALILENYVIAIKRDHNSLQPTHAEAFVKAWAEFDPHATGKIALGDLTGVIKLLPPPLGLDPAKSTGPFRSVRAADVHRYALQLDLHANTPSEGDGPLQVRFTELLAVLVRDAYNPHEDADADLVARVSAPASYALGHKWANAGDERPATGHEISASAHPALAEALAQGTLEFSQDTFDGFEVTGLRPDSWIAVRGEGVDATTRYFKPVVSAPQQLRTSLAWDKVLPPANSRAGEQLYQSLEAQKIITVIEGGAGAPTQVSAAGAKLTDVLRQGLANEVINRATARWQRRAAVRRQEAEDAASSPTGDSPSRASKTRPSGGETELV